MKLHQVCVVIISALLVMGCQARTAAVEPSPILCGGTGSEATCRATFRALAQDVARFEGKKIRIEGFLVVERGLFLLYASRELYEAGVTDEVAVRLRGPVEEQERIFKDHAYSWVSIVGGFRANVRNGTTDDLLLGELHSPLEVRSLRWVPLKREQFDDVRIDLKED